MKFVPLTAGLAVVALSLTGCGTTAGRATAQTAPATSATGHQPVRMPVPQACPTPSPLPPGHGVMIDYVPTVVWHGRHYAALGDMHGHRGGALFTIGCAIQDIGKDGTVPVPEPWPDRTASLLPAGTPIYAVIGSNPTCRITDGQLIYVAMEPRATVATPMCPSPHG